MTAKKLSEETEQKIMNPNSTVVQWNLYKADTIRSKKSVGFMGMSALQKVSLKLSYFQKYKDNTNIDAIK